MKNVIIEIGAVKKGQWKVRYRADSSLGFRGVRKTATLRLLIAAANKHIEEDEIKATKGVPTLREFFRGMWCRSVVATPTEIDFHPVTKEKTMIWQVIVQYDSEMEINHA